MFFCFLYALHNSHTQKNFTTIFLSSFHPEIPLFFFFRKRTSRSERIDKTILPLLFFHFSENFKRRRRSAFRRGGLNGEGIASRQDVVYRPLLRFVHSLFFLPAAPISPSVFTATHCIHYFETPSRAVLLANCLRCRFSVCL